MRTIYSILALVLVLAAGAVQAEQSKTVRLRVDGLSCPFCAYGLEKKLKAMEGLEKLDIKINEGLVLMTFKADAVIDSALIAKKVNEGGFTAREIVIIESGTNNGKGKTADSKVALAVEGMRCDECVSRVEKALKSESCARDVKVDLKKARAELICTDPDHDHQIFVQKVEKAGFKARLISEKDSSNGKKN